MQDFARRVFFTLIAINLLFVVIYLSPLAEAPNTRFNMDAEIGLPAWFTQTLLFSAAAIATFIGYLKRNDKAKQSYAWYSMGAILLYLSIDEGTALHELIAHPVRQALSIDQGPWIFAWTVPGLVVVLLVALYFARFYFHLPMQIRILLAASALIYVFGGLGMEIVSGFYWSENDFMFDRFYRVLTAIEESLENLGVILTIYTLMSYLGLQKLNLRTR